MRTSMQRALAAIALAATALTVATPAHAQFQQEIRNDPERCRGDGAAIRINLTGVRSSQGTIRVQLYRGIKADWLESGRWIHRIEAPARQGSMSFCMPVPRPGTYAIAVRHDVNDNDRTDITTDGGAMSNNPSINIFNLGKPSYTKTRFDVGNRVVSLALKMRYL